MGHGAGELAPILHLTPCSIAHVRSGSNILAVKCYLDAWKYVASNLKNTSNDNAAIASFSEHWTNAEFVNFVDGLAELVDSFEIQRGSQQWVNAETIWSRVLELEEDFWPDEGEESVMRA